MVLAIKALVTPHGVSSHLIWPFEERLILYLLQNPMHRFLERRINRLSISRPWLPSKVILRSVVAVVPVWPEISHLLKDNLDFSFPLFLVFFNPLYLSIQSMSWCILVTGLLVRDFLKPYTVGRLTLKVLIATSSQSPSISLNISQYLSE